ncbi:MAG: acetate kinase, partial [Clostridia bacterium]|nr:acetate kinase [Clostridia bacterium]
MKILVINCGSSSLKYQLFDMDNESVLAKGNCEKIGQETSFIGGSANGEKFETPVFMANHTEAFLQVKKALTEGASKVIDDLSE